MKKTSNKLCNFEETFVKITEPHFETFFDLILICYPFKACRFFLKL